jgi:hypothetical protein
MNRLNIFRIWAVGLLLISGCASLPAQAGKETSALKNASMYETVLGKPLTDHAVADFLTSNHCASANQFLLCKTAGMALWIDSNQMVETVYLYLNNTAGFEPYQGQLPFGLKFYDTMEAVEYKLKRQGIGKSGLPDVGVAPDRMHYEATYHQAGMTVIYNFPFPDEGATISAVVVTIAKGSR